MKKKLLTTLVLFASLAITACGGNGGEGGEQSQEVPATSEKAPASSKHTHKWDAGEVTKEATCEEKGTKVYHCTGCDETKTEDVKAAGHKWVNDDSKTGGAATCEHGGTKYEKCSVCGKTQETAQPDKLAHNWEKVADRPAGDGYIASAQYKCSLADHYAIRWDATDFDATESYDVEKNASNVRLKTAENKGGTEAKGSHLVYKINVGTAVSKASLAFDAKTKSGYTVPVFDYVSNDDQQGYVKQSDGTLKLTTKRYGLIVNGQEITLGEDNYGEVDGVEQIFDWAVEFPLVAGVNTIDVYCLGGYRAYINAFLLTLLPQNA